MSVIQSNRGRRAVQIVTVPGFATKTGHYEPAVFALCADGTIWRGWHPDAEWTRMSPIPTEKTPAPTKPGEARHETALEEP